MKSKLKFLFILKEKLDTAQNPIQHHIFRLTNKEELNG